MKKYINQYRTETVRGENNKKIRNVIYTGDYYEVKKEKVKRKDFFLSAVFFMILHFAAGMLNTPSSRVFYVVLPYTILFLPGVYFIMGAFTFNKASKKMEFPTYDKSIVRIRRSLRGMSWGVGYLLIAEMIFTVIHLNQNGLQNQEWLREGGFLVICVANFVQIIRNKRNIDGVEVKISPSSKKLKGGSEL